jgi:hypothetical protein
MKSNPVVNVYVVVEKKKSHKLIFISSLFLVWFVISW